MVGLTRTKTRLLRTVNKRPHATEDDHEDAQVTTSSTTNGRPRLSPVIPRAETDEEIWRDPQSSDDDTGPSCSTAGSHTGTTLQSSRETLATSQTVPSGARPLGPVSGRRTLLDGTGDDDEDDGEIFSQCSSQSKRAKTRPFNNIHTLPKKVVRKPTTYSRGAKPMLVPKGRDAKRKFKTPGGGDIADSAARTTAPKPTFKIAGGESFGNILLPSSQADAASPMDDGEEKEDDGDDTELFDMVAEEHDSKVECHVCNARVAKLVWESFEDKHHSGTQLSYKWSQRFCSYHRQQEALQVWEQRAYPEIDWLRLPARLQSKSRTKRLEAILGGQQRALYQDMQEERVKGRKQTALQAATHGDEKSKIITSGAGYYGPRGEKLVTDYILETFADKLRRRATKDRVVAAAGVSGGISGFVQAILVPELIVTLIAEDLSKDDDEAMRVMGETTPMGELLHPEEEDVVDDTEMTDDDE